MASLGLGLAPVTPCVPLPLPCLCSGRASSALLHRATRRADSSRILGGVERSCWLGEFDARARSRRNGRPHGIVNAKRLQIRASVDELLHNQVLVSAVSASFLGQLAKPFTYAFAGKGFNWKVIFKPGGMPSTHSATVTAAATALGLERGLSDPVFGLAVILAGIVMYDAQGVRRSVGYQAEVLNTMVLRAVLTDKADSDPDTAIPNPSSDAIGVELARDPVQAELAFMEGDGGSTSLMSKATALLNKQSSLEVNGTANPPSNSNSSKMVDLFRSGARRLPSLRLGEVSVQEIGDLDGWKHIPLKETVGHSPVEVLVGAIWGIAVAALLPISMS